MSETQQRFFDELLSRFPRLAEFWDREERKFKDEVAEDALRGGALSSGERVVLKALASIWLGSAVGGYEVDFSDLGALSPEFRQPLGKWLLTPFFP